MTFSVVGFAAIVTVTVDGVGAGAGAVGVVVPVEVDVEYPYILRTAAMSPVDNPARWPIGIPAGIVSIVFYHSPRMHTPGNA